MPSLYTYTASGWCLTDDGVTHKQVCFKRGPITGDVVPAVSKWSLAVLALLGLCTGTMVFRRRQPVAA